MQRRFPTATGWLRGIRNLRWNHSFIGVASCCCRWCLRFSHIILHVLLGNLTAVMGILSFLIVKHLEILRIWESKSMELNAFVHNFMNVSSRFREQTFLRALLLNVLTFSHLQAKRHFSSIGIGAGWRFCVVDSNPTSKVIFFKRFSHLCRS